MYEWKLCYLLHLAQGDLLFIIFDVIHTPLQGLETYEISVLYIKTG